MKLLFDENLSPKLVDLLSDIFPECSHVRDIGMASASDPTIWQHALKEDLIVVSKDEDFHHLSFLRGAPPKVIGIHLGNSSTKRVAQLLRERHAQITAFNLESASAFLPLP